MKYIITVNVLHQIITAHEIVAITSVKHCEDCRHSLQHTLSLCRCRLQYTIHL